MANERKEPTLSSSTLNDSQSPQGKEPISRTGGRNTPVSKATARSKQRPVKPVVVKQSSNGLIFFVMFLALVALGGFGFTFWQLQQANQLLLSQQLRIADLENKLTVSDDASSQSMTSLAANIVAMNNDVKLSLTEIDKLWATRNVNKKAIAQNAQGLTLTNEQLQSNKSALNKVNQTITSLQMTSEQIEANLKAQTELMKTQFADASKKSEIQTAVLAELDQKIELLETNYSQLEQLSKNLKTQTSQQDITLQSLRERVASATNSANNQLSAEARAQLNQLSTQVNDNQEAIAAIDAFRITVNRELLLLKQRTQATP